MASRFGTVPHVGARYVETLSEARRTVTAPSSFWNTPLPDNVATVPAETATLRTALAAQAAGATVNHGPWSCPVYVAAADHPLTPVKYLGYQGNGAIQPIQRPLREIVERGIPIPEGHAEFVAAMQAVSPPDTDLSFSVWQPDWVDPTGAFRGRLFEGWRLRPDMRFPGFEWSMWEGGRMTGTATSPGHWRNRFNGATYSTMPTRADLWETVEHEEWGSTAGKLPLAEGIITIEDLEADAIRHAVAFACKPAFIRSGKRWPAMGYDTSTPGGALQSGQRIRLAPGYVPSSNLHPVAAKVAVALRDYGGVHDDRAGALTFRAEPGAEAFWSDVASWQVLLGFPFDQVQSLAIGSDGVPNPLAVLL